MGTEYGYVMGMGVGRPGFLGIAGPWFRLRPTDHL